MNIKDSVSIPNSVNSIGERAFSNCTGLTSIIFPESLTSIRDGAFEYCSSLKSIIIPTTITLIGDFAFRACSGLTSIHARSLIPLDLSNSYYAFFEIPTVKCTLYVPKDSKTAYENAVAWNYFYFHIVEEDLTSLQNLSIIKRCVNIKGGKMVLTDLHIGDMVQIFTSDGKIVFSEKAEQLSMEIQLPTNKMYIINIGTKSVKIIL